MVRRRTALLVALLFVFLSLFNGVLSGEVIVKNGVVKEDERVELEPGTTVVVEGPWVVKGELKARGEKGKPVVFDLTKGTIVIFGKGDFNWAIFEGGKGANFYYDRKSRKLTLQKPDAFFPVGKLGGAITSFSDLKCANCRFLGCGDSECRAGGVYGQGEVFLENVKFVSCRGRYGGGAFLGRGEINVERAVFKKNRAREGGGLFLASCRARCEGISFVGNRAEKGGALYLHSSATFVENGVFMYNRASSRGVVYVENDRGSEFRGLKFVGNGAKYGIVYFESSPDFKGFEVVEDEDNRCVGGKEFLSYDGEVDGTVKDPYRYKYGKRFYALGRDLVSGNEVNVPKEGVCVVVFMADWCGFCKMLLGKTVWHLKEELEKAEVPVFAVAVRSSTEKGLKEKVLNADWRWFPVVRDESGELSELWGGISGIPVSFFLVNGKVEKRVVGYVGEDEFRSVLEDCIKKYEEEMKVEQASRSGRFFLSE